MGKWHADARRLADLLFSVSPFRERKTDFNVWALDIPSEESGVARPSDGVHRRSALRAAYDAFGSERYVLAFDNKRLREAAAAAPYDVMEIVVNGRKYGGAASSTSTPRSPPTTPSRPTSSCTSSATTSPASPTSTTPPTWLTAAPPRVPSPGSGTSPPTRHRPSGRTSSRRGRRSRPPGRRRPSRPRRRRSRPTAEDPAEKRPEEEMEALFREEQRKVDALLAEGPHAAAVGAFEGAMYEAKGYYRARRTASCSPATRRSAGPAARRSRGSSISTPARRRELGARRYHGATVTEPKDEGPSLFVQSLPGRSPTSARSVARCRSTRAPCCGRKGTPATTSSCCSRGASRSRTRRRTARRSRSATSTGRGGRRDGGPRRPGPLGHRAGPQRLARPAHPRPELPRVPAAADGPPRAAVLAAGRAGAEPHLAGEPHPPPRDHRPPDLLYNYGFFRERLAMELERPS